jgi:hypothetical protein
VLTGLGSRVTLWNHPCGFITYLGGDIVVETWNNNVYGWVERPWYATNWCLVLENISALCYGYLPVYLYFRCVFNYL